MTEHMIPQKLTITGVRCNGVLVDSSYYTKSNELANDSVVWVHVADWLKTEMGKMLQEEMSKGHLNDRTHAASERRDQETR